MKRIFVHLKPYRWSLIWGALLMAAASVSQLLLPAYMSKVVDEGIYKLDFSAILVYCGIMLAFSLLGAVAGILGRKMASIVVSGFCADLRGAVFGKVMGISHRAFGKMDTGAMVTRSTQDIMTISWIADMLSSNIISIPAMFIGGVVLSYLADPKLSLIILCAVPLVFVFVALIGRNVTPRWERSDAYIDKQNELMRQRLRGIRVIRAFRREADEHQKIADATNIMADNIIKSNVAMQSINPIAAGLLNSATVLILYLAARGMENGSTAASGGDVLALVQYVTYIVAGVLAASHAIVMIPRAGVACRRMLEVLDLPDDEQSQGKQQQLQGGIALENVTFSFEPNAKPAVEDVSMEIYPGKKVAIIGSTGSGKSTLVKLLLGFRQPSSGQIFFDGTDSLELNGSTIRSQISCVLQKTAIFTGSIRENIAMGKPDATDEEIWRALEIAQIKDFVEKLPDGLDYELELSGSNLSGGQRQRIAIARAIIKDAPIYIFDDSFSALDFLTESRLRARLRQELKDKTQIVVTQRVTTAKSSDCIFVMERGKVIDFGRHEELLPRCQVYREIYISQTGGDSV